MVCVNARTGPDFRVVPAVPFRDTVVARVAWLVEQREGDGWREVARAASQGDAQAEAGRLRRVRAAIRSDNPN